jgi:hypothetical protein
LFLARAEFDKKRWMCFDFFMENPSGPENVKIIKSDFVANNFIPILMAAVGCIGYNGEQEKLNLVLAQMAAFFGIGHAAQFLNAYLKDSMDVRRYVLAVLSGSERVRGEKSPY